MNEIDRIGQMKNIQGSVPSKPSSATPRSKSQAPLFAALGDETRLSLIVKLSHGMPYSISQLAKGSKLTRQAITKHLRILERDGAKRSGGKRDPLQARPEVDSGNEGLLGWRIAAMGSSHFKAQSVR
jgi:hypothetical protein